MKRSHAVIAFLFVLTGCASLGIAPAESLKQRMAYGYGTYSAVNYAAANGITRGELSPSDGDSILKITDQGKALLDSAKLVVDTDPKLAENRLVLALTILQSAQAFIDKKAKS